MIRIENARDAQVTRRQTRKRRALSLGASTLVFALIGACGSYDQGNNGGGAGSPVQPTAGAPGGAGAPSTGGGGQLSAGAPGTAGTGGAVVVPEKASCTNISACGGDAVGTWMVADSCLAVSGVIDMSGFGLGCTEAPVMGTLTVTGTWTAMADGTYTDGTTTAGNLTLEVPASCLNVSGTITQCSRVGRALRGVGFATVECMDNATTAGCSCAATASQTGGVAFLAPDVRTSGRYVIEGGNVIAMSDPIETKYDYCVAANTMLLSVKTVSKAGTVTGSVLLRK